MTVPAWPQLAEVAVVGNSSRTIRYAVWPRFNVPTVKAVAGAMAATDRLVTTAVPDPP